MTAAQAALRAFNIPRLHEQLRQDIATTKAKLKALQMLLSKETLLDGYALNDGQICSLTLSLNYDSAIDSRLRQAVVELLIRKKAGLGKWAPCRLRIQLLGVQKVIINEEFDSHYYSDVVFKKLESGIWYLSLDPFGNSDEPHQEDNLVIIADSIEIEEKAIQDSF